MSEPQSADNSSGGGWATSSSEYHDRLHAFLEQLRPRVDDDAWNRFVTPYVHGAVYRTLLINVVALVRVRQVQLQPDERRTLDELLETAGVRAPGHQAAPVEHDAGRG